MALERVCDYAGIKVNINGFYVGINPHANNFVKHNKAKGYLFAPQYKEHLYELQKNFTSICICHMLNYSENPIVREIHFE